MPKLDPKDDAKFRLRDLERQKKQEKAQKREALKKKKTKVGKPKLKPIGKINKKSATKGKKPNNDENSSD